MSFEHHAFKWKKPNLHASISVLIVFTQAICRRPRQSWKGIHPEGCFRATDYGALGPATMPIRIGYNKKQILLEADHSFIYLPKKKPNVVLSNQHAGLSYQPKTKTKLGSLQSASWLSSRRKLLTHTLQPTPIHSTQPPSSPFYTFHSTPLRPRPVTCAAPPRQSEILGGRRNGVSL